ncbi:MAG: long-chain-fatty-acid--CoA ligase [Actinobacteria bacterium]|nr:long-chain-fatty-acid--CoA ligase [Actinomycetota bacterium]
MTSQLSGLMQDSPLTYGRFVRRMTSVTSGARAIGVGPDGKAEVHSYGEIATQILRLNGLLKSWGIEPGDRVASLAFNTVDHLVLFLGVPASGAVLQTVNPRFTPSQTEYVLRHGGARTLFVQEALLGALRPMLGTLPSLERIVVTDGTGTAYGLPALRDLLDEATPRPLPEIPESAASGLCYTSGTTGDPKGVLYSHRSTVLHALSACMTDVMAVSQAETILPIVPMFHANAWGLPHAAALVGADLVLPGKDLSGAAVGELMREHAVTLTAGVPTVLTDLLAYADRSPGILDSLRTAISGGSALQRPLVEGFRRHQVEMIQGWGMTETSPCVSMSRPPRRAADGDDVAYRLSAGRINPLVDARLVDTDGTELVWDGVAVGEIELRSPHAASAYFRQDPTQDDKFDDGWLRTGDAASVTPDGYVVLRDRLKDMIKSGGEWIPSAELEFAVADHPSVREVAVVAVPDERWGERPEVVLALHQGAQAPTLGELQAFLEARVPRWWLPDQLRIVDEIPKTSVGKLDKKALRAPRQD